MRTFSPLVMDVTRVIVLLTLLLLFSALPPYTCRWIKTVSQLVMDVTRTIVLVTLLLYFSALPPYTCRWMSKPYSDGDTFPAGDGCNTCTCNSGAVSCTAKFSCPSVG